LLERHRSGGGDASRLSRASTGADSLSGGSPAAHGGVPQHAPHPGNVFFEPGQATITPGAKATIDRLAEFLKQNPDQRVRIDGYADSSGSQTNNVALSERARGMTTRCGTKRSNVYRNV
jgi:outer membrane protein OmpA-like peptidoglycan-associated protein